MTPEEARYAAMRAFGGIEQRKEECRDVRGTQFIDLASSHVIASLLFGVTARDTSAFAGAAGAIGLATLLATLLPARRAARVDPMVALRCE